MRKFIYRLIIFILLVLVIDQLVGRLLKQMYFSARSGVNYETTYVMDSTRAVVVILGSSRASHHYIPQIIEDSLDLSCYNGGRDGMGIFYCEAVFQSIIRRYTPKIVVLDVDQLSIFEGGERKGELAVLLPYGTKDDNVKELLTKKDKSLKLKMISQIYPFNSSVITLFTGRSYDKNKLKGYQKLEGSNVSGRPTTQSDILRRLDSAKIISLENIIRLSKTKGIRLVLIQSPRFKLLGSEQFYSRYAKMNSLEFYNLVNDSLFMNHPDYFKDGAHLNHIGATVFSNLICRTLKHN